jgi:hypothetical protein
MGRSEFEAVDGGCVRWLMVADLRELPTLEDLLAGLRVGPLSRQGYVMTCNRDATALHPGLVMMLSTSRHSVVVALSGATTPWAVTPMRDVSEWEGFGPLVSRPA